jgi:hypothetical protein
MTGIRRLASLSALWLVPTALFASASLVLNDGQVIKGTDVSRDGDSYLVTMVGGNTVAFPAALVKEVKIEDDAPPPPPPGFDTSGPKQLAGPPVDPAQQQKDATAVMANTQSTWSKSAVDTTWVPTNAYDPNVDVMAGSRSTWSKSAVDTTWVPTNAYDPNANVMANTQTQWSKSAVDTTWQPQDGFGFKPMSFKGAAEMPPEFVAAIPASAPAPYGGRATATPSGPTPWMCAESIFSADPDKPVSDKNNRAASLEVRSVKSPLYASLGLPLYEAQSGSGNGRRKAVFAITGGKCRLVGGDVDAILGMNLTADHAMAQDNASFNAAMASRGGANAPAGVDKLDYALALVSLTDPRVSGERAATLKLISKPDELRSIAAAAPTKCALSKGKRRKEERAATAAFATPRISSGKDGEVVTFLTWSNAGGMVYKNTVVLARGGVVSADRSAVASHVGAHQD